MPPAPLLPVSERLAWTYEEAAEVTGLSPKTLERLVKRRQIPFWQIGPRSRVMFPKVALADYVNRQAAEAVEPSNVSRIPGRYQRSKRATA